MFRKIRRRARHLRTRALDELLASEERADALGAAVRQVQKGRRALDDNSAKMLGAMGLASREDLEHINRKVARLRKRLRGVLEQLEED